ncbi:MAG: caspase family protein, partial [Oculatellaceae cyanobacterium Prado106]|nr:caspase family protein [Oculatellaceae cyanobacterium Prado106]
LSEAGWMRLGDRYQQALAQPTRRKLALLVGINQYAEQVCDYLPQRGSALNGCLTDVELQRELLIQRFGFQASDILTLTDQQATREGIETAFLHHLTAQARPGDVVVFHFSGLGSRVQWHLPYESALEASQKIDEANADLSASEPSTSEPLSLSGNSWVPFDGLLPTAEQPLIQDILEETLGLLVRSLSTQQVTLILDSSHTNLGHTLQGNLRIRSRPSEPSGQIHPAELAMQESLMHQTRVSREQIQAQWRSGQLPGIRLTAAQTGQIATEGQWSNWSAGLFTYALTQQLWCSTPAATLRVSFNQAIAPLRQSVGLEQQPTLTGQNLNNQTVPPYSLPPNSMNGADGVIEAIEADGKPTLLLTGLPALALDQAGASLFTVLSSGSAEGDRAGIPLLQLRSREGLLAKAKICCAEAGEPPQVGQLVQEAVRILPRNLGLVVALDSSLARIERVDATSALAAIPKISSVIAGEQAADLVFGKSPSAAALTATLGVDDSAKKSGDGIGKSGYGLFEPGMTPIPNSLRLEEEAVKKAVSRITPQLRTQLATKLLRLTENRGSSRLSIQVTLETIAPQERIISQQSTVRSPIPAPASSLSDLLAGDRPLPLAVKDQIQYRLNNYGDRPLYFMLLGLDRSGNAIALNLPAAARQIPPHETILLPQPGSGQDWLIQPPAGLTEIHLVFSTAPLTQAYTALASGSPAVPESNRILSIPNRLEVVQALLQDLHQNSAEGLPKADIPPDTYALDVNAWATLGFIYQVVEG